MKEGCSNIYCGVTGSGKTPKVREQVHEFPMINSLVYDPNYEQEPNYSWQKKGNYPYEDWTVYHEWKPLLTEIRAKRIKAANLVLEDATVELSGMADTDIKSMLVAIEHCNNIGHYVFHGLIDVPPVFFRQCHFLYLFKTGDFDKTVRLERQEFYNIYTTLKKSSDKNIWACINLRERDTEGNYLVDYGTGFTQYD